MLTNGIKSFWGAIAAGSLLITGAATAQDEAPTEPESPAAEASAKPELPEKVAELVNAMSGVQHVEKLESGLFAVHRRMNVTGSRIPRDVKLEVAENGEVVDWGRTPLYSRTYTRRELIQTGNVDLGEALQRLDPSIRSQGGG